MVNDSTIVELARAYGATWAAFDAAGDEAERTEGARKDYGDATKERLSALAYERSVAHIKLLRALGIEVRS